MFYGTINILFLLTIVCLGSLASIIRFVALARDEKTLNVLARPTIYYQRHGMHPNEALDNAGRHGWPRHGGCPHIAKFRICRPTEHRPTG